MQGRIGQSFRGRRQAPGTGNINTTAVSSTNSTAVRGDTPSTTAGGERFQIFDRPSEKAARHSRTVAIFLS